MKEDEILQFSDPSTISLINLRSLTVAFSINVFFIALCLIFGDIQYGAIDDYYMAAILSGAHGSAYNPHLLFVNAIYGYALLPLYKLFPSIGWFYIGELVSVFISFTTASYIIIQKMGTRWGAVLASILVAFFASDYYQVAQFTRCASVLGATGMLVFVNAVIQSASKDNPHSKGFRKVLPFIYAIFLLLWGSIMRWQAFLMGMPFFAMALLFSIKQCWMSKFHVIAGITIIFAAAYAMQYFDNSLYQNETYSLYKQIQGPRSALTDGKNYDFTAVYEDLNEMGKSGEDFKMITDWVFYDTELFAKDSLNAFIKVMDQYRTNVFTVKLFPLLKTALSYTQQRPPCWAWFAAALLVILTNRKRSANLWVNLAIILFLFAQLLDRKRFFYHVESGLWIYATFMIIPLWEKIKIQINRKTLFAFLGVIVLSNIITYAKDGNFVRSPVSGSPTTIVVNDSTDYKKIFDYIEQNKDKMFLIDMIHYQSFSFHRMPPYKAEPIGSFKNIVSLGYWTPYLPDITESLKEYGITNPLKEVVNDNVIVINEGNLCNYLQRHYYDSVAVDTLKIIDKVIFYKYRLVDQTENELTSP